MAKHVKTSGSPRSIRDVMTPAPRGVDSGDSVVQAARAMRDHDIGDVLVTENGRLVGVVTDRDLVIRALADGREPSRTTVGEVCSRELSVLGPEDSVDQAVDLMRRGAIRRLPIVEDGRPVGIVSLGDLARARDPESALGGISEAPPNR